MATVQSTHAQVSSVSANEQPPQVLAGTVILLFALALAFNLWAMHAGWQNSITNLFSFRQCQTAIIARTIQEGGPLLPYETPVLGPPWTLPYEFPVYEALVAWTARLLPIPLVQSGRLFSVLFFYLTLVSSWYCLALLNVRPRERLMMLALILASPFYIFWSRAFMIESTALFLSVTYLALVLGAFKSPVPQSSWLLAGIAVTGSLAGVVKVTTFAAFILAGACALLWKFWKERTTTRTWAHIPALLAATLIPFVVTSAWTQYTDFVKESSPMSAFLTSKALAPWHFGTLAQRFELANYARFATVIDQVTGNKAILVLILLGLIFAKPRRRHIALCLALWVITLLIFFNLHYWHAYYGYANAIFLLAALGFVIIGFYERIGAWRWLATYALAFGIGTSFAQYVIEFYPRQLNNFSSRGAIAHVLAEVTKPEQVLLIYGLDWDPELPFLAHRRAIMSPFGFGYESAWRFALAHLPPRELGAVVVCGSSRNAAGRVQNLLRELSFDSTAFTDLADCDIYLPQAGSSSRSAAGP